ncbi:glycosyltransferase [Gordonia lacunae]|uniref:Glycosyltransferase n=1 Tax=Gordonia lacunae TaxID=417102 RepID=A0A243Q8G4_9ACTN|nr:glycosyltransferase [Gordonia lacunae]OUC77805.1 hypothetical protein CA982_15265 [Gordonia lacunae]
MIVSWVRTHGRSRAIAEELSIKAIFLSEATARRSFPTKYLFAAIETVREIRRERPSSVILMLPPFPLLVLVRVCFPRLPVIADLHTGAFLNPKWRPFLKPTFALLREGSCIVTNSALQQQCNRAGVEAIVLHDPLPERMPEPGGRPFAHKPAVVLCPLGYANDEPIDELLFAAGHLVADEIEFRFTGKAPLSIRQAAPTNVLFTGYLTDEDYEAELANCDVVIALTTREHTMQRAGYEAMTAAKPQVTSDFEVLRDFHADAAIYVDPSDPQAISEAVTRALRDADALAGFARTRFEEVRADQSVAIDELRRVVKSAEARAPFGGRRTPSLRGKR